MGEFWTFMRGRLAEVLLLTIASAALFSTATYGFHIDDSLRTAWAAIIAIPLVLTLYFTAISYTPRSVIVGSVAFVVVFGIVSVAMSAASGHAFFYDEYGNVGFFLMLGTIVTLLGYVATRKRALAIVYAIAGSFACGLIQFLYLNGLVVQAVAFAAAAIALCVVCGGRAQARGIAADEVPSWQFLATGLAIASIALGVAGVVFALVVVPLNPPAHEVKLFTEYFSLETVHVRGEQAVEHQEDDALVSQNEKESEKKTNKSNDNDEKVKGDQTQNTDVGSKGDQDLGTRGYDVTGYGTSTSASDYFNDLSRWLFVIPLVILLVIAIILARKLWRRHRYGMMMGMSPRRRVVAFYRFFDKRLHLLGIERNGSATPLEHAENVASSVALLERGADGATYRDLSRAYCACVYGAADPAEEMAGCCERLYRVFYRNARRYLGLPRYLLRFFRL